jgi:hypothetical protein
VRPSQLRRALWTLALGLPLTALTACGASITALYEGDVRFEHCMALDEESTAKASHRAACWSEWVAHYSFGQTRDRIDYAKRRVRRLEGSEPEGSEPKTVGVGAPSSTHAPPPLIERSDAGAPAPAPSASVAPPPLAPRRGVRGPVRRHLGELPGLVHGGALRAKLRDQVQVVHEALLLKV